MNQVLQDLQAPFPAEQVAWRVVRSGTTEAGDPWIRAVPYLHARTIQERLDDVCGPGGWRVEYRDGGAGRLICALGVLVDGEWLWKEDGTGQMESRENFSSADAGKGDFSNAFKRAAGSGLGIGRYLGHLSADWAEIQDGGRFRSYLKPVGYVNWDPPELPDWALPGGDGRPEEIGGVDPETGEVQDDDESPADRLRKLRNDAIRADVLNDAAAARVDRVLEQGDEDKVRGQVKWLERKLEKAGEQ